MEWKELVSESQLSEIMERSEGHAQIIFKHSTRCSISKTVWNRMERFNTFPEDADYYYLDLIAYRDISNKVSDILDVAHESPQVLIIKEHKVVYHADHFEITVDEMIEHI